jgi:hypothetical protein
MQAVFLCFRRLYCLPMLFHLRRKFLPDMDVRQNIIQMQNPYRTPRYFCTVMRMAFQRAVKKRRTIVPAKMQAK